MTERYPLNTSILPTIPTPHDCIIKEIKEDSEYLIFVFEDHLNDHDSIRYTRPHATGLTICFHKSRDYDDSELYLWNYHIRRSGYMPVSFQKLFRLTDARDAPLEYLYHYVGDRSVIIKLFSRRYSIQLELMTDCAEFQWTEA